jgi:hypothetical protein
MVRLANMYETKGVVETPYKHKVIYSQDVGGKTKIYELKETFITEYIDEFIEYSKKINKVTPEMEYILYSGVNDVLFIAECNKLPENESIFKLLN